MNSATKITLSDEELELVTNTAVILTKRIIIEKVCTLFGQLATQNMAFLQKEQSGLPAVIFTRSPKISKGENYFQLPYVILDHPGIYEKQNILAIRTMFWWGNFCSVTLQLSGSFKKQSEQRIIDNIVAGYNQELYVCINEDQWQHHFEEDNYILLKNKNAVEIQEIISQQAFIKLALKFSLDQWEQLSEKLAAAFEEMINMIRT